MTASADRTVAIWDAFSGRLAREKLRCPGEVHEVWFSPNGLRLLAVHDNAVTVFDSTSGKCISSGIRHPSRIHHATFSPDGLRVLTAGQDSTAAVWDAETGKQVVAPIQHALGIASTSFNPDGRSILTASADGTGRLWDLPSRPLTVEDAGLWACLLSHHGIDATGGSVRVPIAEFRAAWDGLKEGELRHFRSEAEQAISWHFREARAFLKEGSWACAVRHLDAIIAARPADFVWRGRRARACAEMGDLGKAAADFEAALALGSGDLNDGYNAALTHLASGDVESYRRACQDLLARSATMQPSAHTATNVALACVLAPDGTRDHAAVLVLAERLMSLEPRQHWSHIILGAALHRAGRHAQAVVALRQAIALTLDGGEPIAQCLLPLALEGLGEKESARRELRAAQALGSRYLQPAADATPGASAPWWRRLRVKVLLDEAERLLGSRAAPTERSGGLLERLARSLRRALESRGEQTERSPASEREETTAEK